jgi:anionic cell wall polymer biosynthesis LytR-Cps2A-Psr (LCP) family protein
MAKSVTGVSKSRVVKTLFLLAGLACGVVAGYVGYLAWTTWQSLNSVLGPTTTDSAKPQAAVGQDWESRGRVNVLLLGIDRRWNRPYDPGRTNTMMVVTIDPYSEAVTLLSIPRDLWVPIALTSERTVHERINAAYFMGEAQQLPGAGVAVARRAVEDLVGIRIDYSALVDFNGFVRLVDR